MESAKVLIVLLFFISFIISCASLTYSPLMKAVNNNDSAKTNTLLDQGTNVNENKNTYKYTPLMLAAYNGNYEMAKLLIDKGADINENNNNKAYSALMWACLMAIWILFNFYLIEVLKLTFIVKKVNLIIQLCMLQYITIIRIAGIIIL